MKRRERIINDILSDLAGFIYDQELNYGYEACLEKCEQNRVRCPYGEEHSRENCLNCFNEFLDKENK